MSQTSRHINQTSLITLKKKKTHPHTYLALPVPFLGAMVTTACTQVLSSKKPLLVDCRGLLFSEASITGDGGVGVGGGGVVVCGDGVRRVFFLKRHWRAWDAWRKEQTDKQTNKREGAVHVNQSNLFCSFGRPKTNRGTYTRSIQRKKLQIPSNSFKRIPSNEIV
jgi:hypothetical protein